MLSDKEITSVIGSLNSVIDKTLNRFYDECISAIVSEDSNRKQIVSSICDFRDYCICTFGVSLENAYIKGYKKGYEDALLKSSGLSLIVDKAIKRKKKH